jgi:single-strand DNA-binding protein
MAGFNKVILMGNLTRDPQLRYLPNNTAVCDFGLAVNRRWRDREGNQHDEVCYVDLAAFGRQAEVINQYMSKGRPMLVDGRLKFDSWTGQDGQKRSKLSIVVENFQFVGPREGAAPGGAPGGGYSRDTGGYDQGGGDDLTGAGREVRPPESAAPDGPPPASSDIPF